MSRLAEAKIYIGALMLGGLLAVGSSVSGFSRGITIAAAIAISMVYVVTSLLGKAGHWDRGRTAERVAPDTPSVIIHAPFVNEREGRDSLAWTVTTYREDNREGEASLRYRYIVPTQNLTDKSGPVLFIELKVLSREESASETLGYLLTAVVRESLTFVGEGYALTGIVLSAQQRETLEPLRRLFENIVPNRGSYFFMPFQRIVDAEFLTLLQQHSGLPSDVARPTGWPESVIHPGPT